MISLDNLSTDTKHLADSGAAILAAISLTQISLILTIVATTLAILWYGVRFYDRFFAGKSSDG